jgi:hypothetical protein
MKQIQSENEELQLPKTLVEGLVKSYFDKASRQQGAAITRMGAGMFQAEILKGLFDTTEVTQLDSA